MFKKRSQQKKDMILRVSLLMTVSLLVAMPAFAALDIGTNVGTWLNTNVGAVIPGIIGAVGVYFLVKRDWPKVISFAALTLVISALMNWTSMQSISTKFVTMIFG